MSKNICRSERTIDLEAAKRPGELGGGKPTVFFRYDLQEIWQIATPQFQASPVVGIRDRYSAGLDAHEAYRE
ncbi:MAG: hypothetical protein JWM11_2615 [Planctomycetaceae bacterium]|nr:hypothetical protein [Planctomycetaceae bacterium]